MRSLKHTLISILLISSLLLASVMIPFSHAEITLDGTLGPSGSLPGPDYVISDDLGSLHGSNLFHSFGEFSVLTGESATFTGPDMIENVIGRVTGGNSSFIDGLLSCTILDANLFLLNPSGVMFGPNATLDVNGSFHVSTADFIRLSDNGVFYADPAQTSVLTVAHPSSFGFLGDNPAGISIEGSLLQVPEGETLSVVGGDIEIIGGTLRAGSGRINIASVASAGEVIPDMSDQAADLKVDTFNRLGEIDIAQDGELTVSGDTPGSIFIRGGNLVLDSSSIFSYGFADGGDIDIRLAEDFTLTNNSHIASDSYGTGQAGDILLEVGSLTISDGSLITTHAMEKSTGQGGNITIKAAESVSISSGSSDNYVQSYISSSTFGNGDGGTISISTPTLIIEDHAGIFTVAYMGFDSFGNVVGGGRAGDIFLDVGSLTITSAGIGSETGSMTTGHAGNITITATDSVFLSDYSGIHSGTNGAGDGGTVSISAPVLTMDCSGIDADTGTYAEGDAGDILVEVGDLMLTGGAQLSSSTHGTGKGGNITIKATASVLIAGRNPDGYLSAILTSTFSEGNGGTVSVSAPTLTIEDDGVLAAESGADGDAGDILVEVGNLTLTGGAKISSSTFDAGLGGTVTVTATNSILISGCNTDGYASEISSGTWGDGNGGTISISAPILTIDDGGVILAGSYADGGDAGNILVEVGSLTLTNGGELLTGSYGAGHGGDLTVIATDSVSISGRHSSGYQSGLYSGASGSGAGGDIVLQARDIQLNDEGRISAQSTGAGNAGSIIIMASDTFLSRNSSVTTEAKEADGGNIQLNAQHMVHLIDSEISASVGGGPETVGGNITIDPEYVILDGSSIIANAYEGKGGNIQISAETFLADPGSVVSASSSLGIHGTVDIRAPVINLSGILAPLPKGFLSAAELLREPCEARLKGGEYSSFVICGRDGLPIQPHGLLPSPIYLEGKCEEED